MSTPVVHTNRFSESRMKPLPVRLAAVTNLMELARQCPIPMRTALAVLTAGMASGAATIGVMALVSAILTGRLARGPFVVAAFVSISVVAAAARLVSETLLIRALNRAAVEMRVRLSRRILSVPLDVLEEIGGHRMLVFLTDDVISIVNALGMVPYQCINLIVVLGGMVYLGLLSRVGSAIVLIFVLAGGLVYQLGAAFAMTRIVQARNIEETLFGHLRALTVGIKELKLHRRRRERFLEALRTTAAAYGREIIDGLTRLRLVSSWSESLLFVLIGLLLFSTALHGAIAQTDRVAFVLTITYMMGPLSGVLNTMPALGRAAVALRKVADFEARLPRAARDAPDSADILPLAGGTLELVDVSHRYAGSADRDGFGLSAVRLTFHPGELVFITGGNGSGKTTLAKLLVGLYAPARGEIRLNGLTIGAHNIEAYRQNFSAVFSDFHLFEDLIGIDPHQIDARATRYLDSLRLTHKLTISEGRFSTTDLSQGQRKRLALLAAYMEDRPYCLFDEWAADQDPTFKEIFYRELLPEWRRRGKTLFVITHDDRYYGVADRVIKLEEGAVVADSATHDAVARRGVPARA